MTCARRSTSGVTLWRLKIVAFPLGWLASLPLRTAIIAQTGRELLRSPGNGSNGNGSRTGQSTREQS